MYPQGNKIEEWVKGRGELKRIIGIIFLCVFVLNGCTTKNNYYYGIEKNDVLEIYNVKNIDFFYEYKGHSDSNPLPTGELSYSYTTEGGGSGSGSRTLSNGESKTGIYYLGSSGGNGSIAAEDSLVKMRVDWNGTAEVVELRPEVN